VFTSQLEGWVFNPQPLRDSLQWSRCSGPWARVFTSTALTKSINQASFGLPPIVIIYVELRVIIKKGVEELRHEKNKY